MATRYLPHGWTEEMLVTATPEQWDALTDEEYRMVCERRVQDSLAIPSAYQADETAATGNTIPGLDLASFVEVIRNNHLQEWGFVVIRATYGSEGQWDQFLKLWDDAIEDQMSPEHGEGIHEVREKLTFEWVEDKDALDGKDMSTIRGYIKNWLTHRELPLGLSHNVCLVVTMEAMHSQLNGSISATFNYANRPIAPFIVALDLEAPDEDEGHFKVAISSLLNEFFPALAGYQLTPQELMPLAEEGGVWFSVS